VDLTSQKGRTDRAGSTTQTDRVSPMTQIG